MKVAVTGSSGFIGSALVPALRAAGHEVVRLVRRPPQAADEVRWDPAGGRLDPADLAGVAAAVHLAGVGVADRRWTRAYRQAIRDSRVLGTSLLAGTLARVEPAPRVLLSASAIGWYGDTGGAVRDESGPRGQGFIPDVVEQWEASTRPAEDAGVRVCHLRSGVVLSRRGGALRKQLPLFRLGLGGPLGSGRQWQSWISMADEVAAILFLLDDERARAVRGPVNLVAPTAVTQRDFARALGRAVRRPALLPAPAFALRLVFPGFADEELLPSKRLRPRVLQDAGYRFRHPRLEEALVAALRE